MGHEDGQVAPHHPRLVDSDTESAQDEAPQSKYTLKRKKRRRRGSLTGGADKKLPLARRLCSRTTVVCAVGILVVLGFVQLLSLLLSFIALFLPNGIDKIVKQWGRPGHIGEGLAHWPTDFTRDIHPIPCHSHNDYWRNVPLYSAIQAGCIGVEADIWAFENDLFVGHSLGSLTKNRTLNSLYIDPLLDILAKMNTEPTIAKDSHPIIHGIFDTEPTQSIVLLIDFKTYGPSTWPGMYKALDPLRKQGYLTHVENSTIVERPITVVGTGNTPFFYVNSTTHNPYQDVFFDAPLDLFYLGPNGETTPPHSPSLKDRSDAKQPSKGVSPSDTPDEESNPKDASAFTKFNSFYASVSFKKTIGSVVRGQFNNAQIDLVRGQIRGAEAKGLKSRYWDTPFWPIGLRNHVWDVLTNEGEAFLNVDDLNGATQRDWGRFKGWWRHGMKT